MELALLSDLKQSIADGELWESTLAPIVLAALQEEPGLELASPYDSVWIVKRIQLSDEYLKRVNASAGCHDWQIDPAQIVAPILVAVAQSLRQSADAQALIVRLCDMLAARLRLKVIWPEDPDSSTEVKNGIYRACLYATEVDSDEVLLQFRRLTVIGPQ